MNNFRNNKLYALYLTVCIGEDVSLTFQQSLGYQKDLNNWLRVSELMFQYFYVMSYEEEVKFDYSEKELTDRIRKYYKEGHSLDLHTLIRTFDNIMSNRFVQKMYEKLMIKDRDLTDNQSEKLYGIVAKNFGVKGHCICDGSIHCFYAFD